VAGGTWREGCLGEGMRPWMRFTFKRFVLLAGVSARALASVAELTPQRVDLLLAIRLGPLVQKEIASELGVTQPVVSRMIYALEKLGMIERHNMPTDRRFKMVSLTAKGNMAIERLYDGFLPEGDMCTIQSCAEDDLLEDYWLDLTRAEVRAEPLSQADQRPLLTRLQPQIRRTIYPPDPRHDLPHTPHRWRRHAWYESRLA